MTRTEVVRGFYIDKLGQAEIKNNEEMFRKLAEAIENGTSEDISDIENEIVSNNLRAIHDVIRRRFGSNTNNILTAYRMSYDDLYSLGYESLVRAIQIYDLSKGYKFITLLYQMLYNSYNKYFERIKMPKNVISMESALYENSDNPITIEDIISDATEDFSNTIVMSEFTRYLLRELKGRVDPRDLQILMYSVESELTQTEIGKKFGISQMQVSRIVRRVQETARQIRDKAV